MPKLIVIAGLPGSGKSTLSEAVAKKLCIPVFSVDPIESAVIGSGFEQSFETGLAAYKVAAALAHEQLKLGISVIIDAVSPVVEARQMWQKLSTDHSARLIIIECINSDVELHQQRIEARVRNIQGIPEVTWEDVEKRRREYLAWTELRLTIDTVETLDANLAKAISYIESA